MFHVKHWFHIFLADAIAGHERVKPRIAGHDLFDGKILLAGHDAP
jgi:hypothetical protein